MNPPLCKLCEIGHWLDEGHAITAAMDKVRELGAIVLRNQTPTVTKPGVENVTSSTAHISPEELEKASYTHGGAREDSGRKRQHKTNASRQRTYRGRSRG